MQWGQLENQTAVSQTHSTVLQEPTHQAARSHFKDMKHFKDKHLHILDGKTDGFNKV